MPNTILSNYEIVTVWPEEQPKPSEEGNQVFIAIGTTKLRLDSTEIQLGPALYPHRVGTIWSYYGV